MSAPGEGERPQVERAGCNTCRFADPIIAGGKFDNRYSCKRYPPPRFTDPRYSVWPIVRPEDWCGEFSERLVTVRISATLTNSEVEP